MWAFLVLVALGLLVLAITPVINSVDERIKAGNYPAAVLKASFTTAAALLVWVGFLWMPLTLANLQQHWWRYVAPLTVVPGTYEAWHQILLLRRRHKTGLPLDAPG